MINIDLTQLKVDISNDLNSQTISGRVLLDRFRVIDELSRKTAAYLDHKYAPFYYYLGKRILPKTMLEIGFDLGLLSGSFLTSCKSVELFLGFKEETKDFIPLRLGKANIKLATKSKKNFHVGKLFDDEFLNIFSPNQWDLVIINDETVYDKHLEYLDMVWPSLSEHGLIIAEYIDRHEPAKEAFFAFCDSKNRKPVMFDTRYGTGILQK